MSNTKTYTVVNNDQSTNWVIGAKIKKISPWSRDGYAAFTSLEGMLIIHAHIYEVK